jgi:heptosyltransferase-2/heptosyltransferase-3
MSGPGRARRVLYKAAGRGRPVPLAELDLAPSARVLLLRPDHLGDVVLTGPAIGRARRLRADLELTLAVGPWSVGAARLLGGATVRAIQFPWFDRRPARTRFGPYTRLLATSRALRRERYAAAFVLRDDDAWSAWLARAAGIPLVIGHGTPLVRGFLTHELAEAPDHAAARSITMLATAIGDSRPADPSADPLILDLERGTRVLEEAQWIGVHPGSGSAVKRWTLDAWRSFGRAFPESVRFVVTGGQAETELAAAVAERLPRSIDLAGQTDLRELATVYRQCRVVVGPDSGPLHLAAAAGVPTVHLFGPAAAGRFGPWGPPTRHRVCSIELACAPCGRLDWPEPADHPCVRLVEPQVVTAAALEAARSRVPII